MLTTREPRTNCRHLDRKARLGWRKPQTAVKRCPRKMLMTGLPLNRKQGSTPPGDRGGGGALRLPTCPRSPRRQTARGPPDSSATAGSPWLEQHRDGSASRSNGLCANARLRTVLWTPRPTRAPHAGTPRQTPGPTSAPTGSSAPERKLCSRRKSRLARGLSPGNWLFAEAVGCVAVLLWSVSAGPGLAFLPGALRVGLPLCLVPWRHVCQLVRACWPWGLTPCKPSTVRMETWRRPSPGPRARLRRRRKVRGPELGSRGRADVTQGRSSVSAPRRPGVEEKDWKRSPPR